MAEQLAIIREVKIGAEDHYGAALWFTAFISEGSMALQLLTLEQAKPLLETVEDSRQLNGKACWVEVDGGLIRFLRLAKI